MAILVILRAHETVSYPTDGDSTAFILTWPCSDGPESYVVISEQFLSNGGGLFHRRSNVMVGSVFWRRGRGGFCTIYVFCEHR